MSAIIVTIMTITAFAGRYICSANSYCDNNWDVYVQCLQLL